MKVLVTGGSGYLGRAIVRALEARGHAAVVFARRPDAASRTPAIAGDIRDADAVDRAVHGCDAVCHAAARVSIVADAAASEAINVGGLRHVLAATRGTATRVVHTSSFLALPPAGATEPLRANDYQATKARALDVAREASREGRDLVVLSPGVIYGPGAATEGNLVARLLRDHMAGRLPGIVGGARTWSFAYVDDVAAAHVDAVEGGAAGAEYGLGGPNVPQRAIFEWLRERTGHALPRELPAWLAAMAGWGEVARTRLLGGVPLVTPGAVEIFRHDWPVDSVAAVRDLGYHVTPLADGLERLWPALTEARTA